MTEEDGFVVLGSSSDAVGCKAQVDDRLAREGWVRRFVADEKRAKEAAESYESLGYEVRLEGVEFDDSNDVCAGCKPAFDHCRAVYTRKL